MQLSDDLTKMDMCDYRLRPQCLEDLEMDWQVEQHLSVEEVLCRCSDPREQRAARLSASGRSVRRAGELAMRCGSICCVYGVRTVAGGAPAATPGARVRLTWRLSACWAPVGYCTRPHTA